MKAQFNVRSLTLAVVGVVFFALPCLAQLAMMKRTPELDLLKGFVGEWRRSADQVHTGGPSPAAAQKAVVWGPGDVWMTWDVKIDFTNGQTVVGRRQIAWDLHKKSYASSWIDSQSAHVIKSVARWSDSKTFEFECEPIPWPDGHAYRFKTQYKFSSATRILETGWKSVDGGEYQQHSKASWSKLSSGKKK